MANAWIRFLSLYGVDAHLLYGIGIALIFCGLFVRARSRGASARVASACLLLIGVLELAGGRWVEWYVPGPSAFSIDSGEAQAATHEQLLAAAVQRERSLLAFAAAALVVALLAWPGARRGSSRVHGARFALSLGGLGFVAQAAVLARGARESVETETRYHEIELVEARAIAECLTTPELKLGSKSASQLVARVRGDDAPFAHLFRVEVQPRSMRDGFPHDCFVSSSDAWCFGYSTSRRDPLERLARDYPLSSLRDADLVEWVAFALGVYVWERERAADYTRAHASPALVERHGGRVEIDFWEFHPYIPSSSVGLRHTHVSLEGKRVQVKQEPMIGPFHPEGEQEL